MSSCFVYLVLSVTSQIEQSASHQPPTAMAAPAGNIQNGQSTSGDPAGGDVSNASSYVASNVVPYSSIFKFVAVNCQV